MRRAVHEPGTGKGNQTQPAQVPDDVVGLTVAIGQQGGRYQGSQTATDGTGYLHGNGDAAVTHFRWELRGKQATLWAIQRGIDQPNCNHQRQGDGLDRKSTRLNS